MTSIISQSTASSSTTTEAPAVRRVHVYLTDSDSEASNEPNKRRRVSKQLYEPVWVQLEPDTHRPSHVKTHSVLTQWKPFPKDQSYAKWNTLVRKLELRKRHIDIYRVDWQEVEAYDFDERPDLYEHPGCRFVDEDSGSCGADTILYGLEQHTRETTFEASLDAYFEEFGIQNIRPQIIEFFELIGVEGPDLLDYFNHFAELGLDREGIIEYLDRLNQQYPDSESESNSDSIPDEVEGDHGYISDLEDPEL